MNPRIVGLGVLAIVVSFGLSFAACNGDKAVAQPTSATPLLVTDVQYGRAYKARTELCVTPFGEVARDWKFKDRWMKNQLSYDNYTVDGRTYSALHIVTEDKTLPKGHVRFRKVVVNIGTGPTLEGHSYLKTLINGAAATMEQELLFVEFNGRLESQRRPLPACGMPRS